ncbi:hypothetical protein BDR03DRAFT_982304 [Suillus americanus]|nr:hypothetical protein BDR03DRAFT_982304 [Suillus americanus]
MKNRYDWDEFQIICEIAHTRASFYLKTRHQHFLDVAICNTAVVGLAGEGTGGKGCARGEVAEGGGWIDGRGLGIGFACEVTTSSSVRRIVAGVDGPLVDISEVDVRSASSAIASSHQRLAASENHAETRLVLVLSEIGIDGRQLLGCALTGSN